MFAQNSAGIFVPAHHADGRSHNHAAIQRLDSTWTERWAPFDQREIYQWIHEEIEDLPSCYSVRGRFDASAVPFVKEVFHALRRYSVRRVISKSGLQSLKTLIGEFWLLWLIDNEPGSTQWLQTTDQEAKEHAKERFIPLIQSCPRIARYFTGDRHDETSVFISFMHMWLRMEGAANKGNLERKTVKNQMCSEVMQQKFWPPGRLEHASSRFTQHEETYKQYIESQAGEEDDDLDLAWKLSSQKIWTVQCQGKCGKHQPLVWREKRDDGSAYGIVWEQSERTRRRRANGKWGDWILDAVKPTIRYECKFCGDPMPDEPRVRRLLNDSGQYHIQNPNAPATHEGFTWNQLTVASISWFAQFLKFQAALADLERGLSAKMVDFRRQVLALQASQNFGLKEITPATEIYEILPNGPEKGWLRFLTIDCQADLGLFYFIIRDWNQDGSEARRVARGTAHSFDDLRKQQKQFGIPDHRVFIDCAYLSRRVWAQCLRFGHWGNLRNERGQLEKHFLCWYGLWGQDRHSFAHVESDPQGNEIRTDKLFSPLKHGDPSHGLSTAARKERNAVALQGKQAPYFFWSNEQVKDALQLYRDQKCEGMHWVNPPCDKNDAEEAEYIRQINSEDKRKRWSEGKGRIIFSWGQISEDRANHFWDCECMQVVAAATAGILTPTPIGDNSEGSATVPVAE